MRLAVLLFALVFAASVAAELVTGKCLTDGHTICPSVNDAPDFCCAPEDTCWRPLRNVSGQLLYARGGCIPRGGVGCPLGHTCAAGQVCCGTKCMPAGSACCGDGLAFCPNGYPCNPENPLKCSGIIAAVSPMLILAMLLLTYLMM